MKKMISIRIDEEQLNFLKDKAAKEKRTVTSYIEEMIDNLQGKANELKD